MSKLSKSEFVKSIIGDAGYEALNKAITKLDTRSVVDIDELHSSIKIVPKSIMSFLILYTKKMDPDTTKTIDLPWADNCQLLLNKRSNDVYGGHISKDGKVVHEFDLVSIPQLAAHLLSYFELYDEVPGNEEETAEASSREESKIDILKEDSDFESKVLSLLTLMAAKVIGERYKSKKEETTARSEESSQEVRESSSVGKAECDPQKRGEVLKKLKKSILKKDASTTSTTGNKMPKPPRPGTKVGGSKGITRGGLHGDKTASTDMPGHPVKTGVTNPDMKLSAQAKNMFKQPKLSLSEKPVSISQVILTKSEYNSQCLDCGSAISNCQCFNNLSKPMATADQDQDKVKLTFKSDWDAESVLSFVRSIKSRKA